MTGDERLRHAFLQSVLAQPFDDTPRLIYADWLMEQGDPYGEFIKTQCDLHPLRAAATKEFQRQSEIWRSKRGILKAQDWPNQRTCYHVSPSLCDQCRDLCTREHEIIKTLDFTATFAEWSTHTMPCIHERFMTFAIGDPLEAGIRFTIQRGFVEAIAVSAWHFNGSAMSMFSQAPITSVKLLKQMPHSPTSGVNAPYSWRLWTIDDTPSRQPCNIPEFIWSKLVGQGHPAHPGAKFYGTEQLAYQDLSRAAVRYAREALELPVIPIWESLGQIPQVIPRRATRGA